MSPYFYISVAILLNKLILERVESTPGCFIPGLNMPFQVDSNDGGPLTSDGVQGWPVRQVRPASQGEVPVVAVGHNLLTPVDRGKIVRHGRDC